MSAARDELTADPVFACIERLNGMTYSEHATPSAKMPNCPICDEDELGAISRTGQTVHVLCYRCTWSVEIDSPMVEVARG